MIRVVRVGVEELSADAFVRPVGSDLEPCSAIGNQIGSLAGPEIMDRLRAFGGLDIGGAVVTPAGGLNAEFLIHVVIRSSEEPVTEDRVARAFQNGLRQAADWGVRLLAVPALGIGPGSLDAERSARVMCRVLADHRRETALPEEILVLAASEYEEDVFAREAAQTARDSGS